MEENIKILMVEDTPNDAELIKREISRNNIRFTEMIVETKEDYINALQSFSPDIILSDFSLPEFDGMQALEIKKEKALLIPFILVTGRLNEDIAVQCMKEGADDYIIKDNPARIGEAIKGALNKKELLRQKIRTEELLQESEELFRTAFESANIGICLVDTKGEFKKVNRTLCKMLGYNPDELIELNFNDIIYTDDKININFFNQQLLDGKLNNNRFEKRFLHKSGKIVWVDISINLISEFSNKSSFFITNILDISEGKSAEITLQKSLRQLEIAMEAGNLAWWEMNCITGNVTFTERKALMLGYLPENFHHYSHFTDLIHPSDYELTMEAMKDHIIGKKENYEVDYRIKTNLGIYKWFHDVGRVTERDSDGRPVIVTGIVIDITERKLSGEAIIESEQKYRDLANLLPSCIYESDLNGLLQFANQTGFDWFGYSETDISKGINILQFIAGKDRQRAGANFQRIISNREISSGEYECIRKNGNTFIAMIISRPILKDNKAVGLRGIVIDITEHKQTVELRIAKEAAEEANRAKSEFLANMSHEIRTPMNAVIGFSDLLYNSIKDEKQRSQVASIRSSAKNLLGIINDILDLSKIEAGKLKIEYKAFNLQNLLFEIESLFSQKIKEKEISLLFELESDLPRTIISDVVRLRQVLFNIIGNAVKFTEKGHVILKIDKKEKPDEVNKIDLIFTIEDTGIGIPKEQQQLIFEAFHQQENQNINKYGGTGLGLTISKRLIEMINGKIEVTSEPGQGSIFTVILFDVEVSGEQLSAKQDSFFDPRSVIFEPAKVLICDDIQSNRKLIVDLLELSPVTVYEAENGKEAVEKAIKYHPDIILMDLKMPVMDGHEAVKILKKQAETKSIPVIAISASIRFTIKIDEVISHFDGFLMKPIDLSDLVECLKKYLKYNIIEKTAFQEEPLDIEIELNDEQKKNLPEIIRTLEKEYFPQFKVVLENQRINKIKEFGMMIVSFGEKNEIQAIFQYGSEIIKLADNFEIESLLAALNRFPVLIKKIKSLKLK